MCSHEPSVLLPHRRDNIRPGLIVSEKREPPHDTGCTLSHMAYSWITTVSLSDALDMQNIGLNKALGPTAPPNQTNV
jgi:hypothetical protein